MSISIGWRLVNPGSVKSLPGLSSDWVTFQEVFGRRNLTNRDGDLLRAMALAAGNGHTLWASLLEVISDLPDDAEIEVEASY